MNGLDELQAELKAFSATIAIIDKQFNDGIISETFYFRRRIALVRDQEVILKKLKGILETHGAAEISSVLDKIASGVGDEEIQRELESAQEAGQAKGWGEAVKQAIDEKKGSIVQTALDAAINVTRAFM